MKGRGPGEVTTSEARAALLRSGYLLESRVEARLRNVYYVEANSTYPDPDTGKSRELDLYANNVVWVGRPGADSIWPVLLIECVNNPQPLAFITKEPLAPPLHQLEIKHAGLPVKFPVEGGWTPLPEHLGLAKFHHYCKGRVATQFCSFRRKKDRDQEWMALHEEDQFDSFRKLCAAVDYYADTHFKGWSFGGSEYVNIEFYYPVLVLGGHLLEAKPGPRSVRLIRRQHLQFRRSQMVRGVAEGYQIDVITESFLPKYLELVQREVNIIARRLRRRRKEVRSALNRIVRTARRLRSPEKIRKAFEF